MPKNDRSRIRRAWSDTTAHWRWTTTLNAVVAGVVGFVVVRHLYSPADAMQDVVVPGAVGIVAALMVTLVSFLVNYARVPLLERVEGLEAEHKALHAENTRLQQIAISAKPGEPPSEFDHLPGLPPKVQLSETPSEIMQRVATFRWNEREAITNATYLGRWIRGSGTISAITLLGQEGSGGFYVVLANLDTQETVWLQLTPEQRPIVEPLDKGHSVAFEGRIKEVNRFDMTLDLVTLRRT